MISAEPVVSVIIASHNAVTTIGDTLESLERQPARRQCEIIVVDSSTDGTGAFVRKHFPGVRLYRKGVFEANGAFIEGTYCSDTEFHWRIAKEGLRIRFDPSIVVFHRNLDLLGRFLRHEFSHGMSFAGIRCRARAFSFGRLRAGVGYPGRGVNAICR